MILCSVAEAVGFFVGLTSILWWISSKFEEIIAPKTIEKIIIMQESINPLFDLVGETTSKKISIKEKVVSKVDFSDVTDEDVYNSFDGLDFKEL